ncbi:MULTISPECIES: DUF2971 domain-containing protein [unclassified Rhizobium]|uniref:DUF2971 domain-containing protein n=1 Tax=unclassified Rhizobium TaxID=2613769 RepID=UPI000BD7698B|nr:MULTISPECIES: DUF2971 domain-containing protein [unclassified Rhizobium]MDH7809851.1 hypothetical protein [Rhizobium sp. AN67]SOD56304.1 Protein of unknown function [Rhizobium sp. AN6A]
MNFDQKLTQKPAKYNNDRLHFFKYMSAATGKIVLSNRTLRWSTATHLNDPFDMQLDLPIRADRQVVRRLALSKLWNLYCQTNPIPPRNVLSVMLEALRVTGRRMTRKQFNEELGAAFDEGYSQMLVTLPGIQRESAAIMKDTKILSLTTRPNNHLMWAHYGSASTGVALRFRSMPEIDGPFGMAKAVNYLSEVPELYNAESLSDIFAGLDSMSPTVIVDKLVYTKSSEWNYEQEWRICSGAGRTQEAPYEDCPFGAGEIDGLIFGMNTAASDKTEFLEIASRYPRIEIFQVARSGRANFDIELRPYEPD